ncbi:MAG: hypothetical protein U0237_07250 [Thermoleophilia bacterium]
MTADAARPLRLALIGLAALSIAGTAVELATLRHWNGAVQLIPWVIAGALAVLTAVLAARPGRGAVRLVRGGAVLAILASAFGVVRHVVANYDTAPLDRVVGPRWDSMSELHRWWEAASGGVGPAPTFAAGVLAQAALCLLAATIRHPATQREA